MLVDPTLVRARLAVALAELAAELEIPADTVIGYWRERAGARMLCGESEDSALRDAYDETVRAWRRRQR